jgi:outer membrane lipoprotein-sorting protein
MWQEMNMGGVKQVIKMDMNKAMSNLMAKAGMKIDPLQAMDPSQQWKTSKELYDYTQVGTETLRGQPMYVIEGTWKPSARTNSQMAAMTAFTGKTRLYIGSQDGFVHKLEQFDRSNTNLFMTMELTNLKFNGELPDDLFTYRPPPDVQVMDMTEMAGAMMAGKGMPPAAPPAPPPSAPARPEPTRPVPAQ